MHCCIIACRTLEKELLAAMASIGCTYPVVWLEAGAHNVPDKRRAEIQNALDRIHGFDTVLLAMSLCGNIAAGLQTHDFQLVVPRYEDCITLLLGSSQLRNAHPGTYFLTEGWLKGADNIWAEYQHSLEKYGEHRTRRIFSAMLANYKKIAFLDTGCADVSAVIQKIASQLDLEYARIPGRFSNLVDLLRGSWDSRFLVVPPGKTVDPNVHAVTVLPQNRILYVPRGRNLFQALQEAALAPDAPCGGNGSCGKCRVNVGGESVLACHTSVTRDMTVTIPPQRSVQILHSGTETACSLNPLKPGHLLAFDIGTTTVVGYLLDGRTGRELAALGMANPQALYGADVISRIRAALSGSMEQLTTSIRNCITELTEKLCRNAGIAPESIGVVSLVGNPAMQQLFLGLSPENLATVPYAPILTKPESVPCAPYLPRCPDAALLIVPDIGGFVGADTLGCVLASKLHESDKLTLLVDIGTNGELVLGNRDRIVACSTAAGPALEGASIRFGMGGTAGAIDHVWLEKGQLQYSVIGGGPAIGICGSGLIDAVAVAMDMGLLNRRGRIQNGAHIIRLTEDIYLTQDDIRQLQTAKGAIHAGILLLAKQLGAELADIQQVLLAGAFGSFLNPDNACRIGLLPPELGGRISSIGNGAGTGAKMIARDRSVWEQTGALGESIEFLELASVPEFPRTFAKAMEFSHISP